MVKVLLANNKGYALVDEGDIGLVSGYKWYLHPRGYAGHKNGKFQVLMHRLVMGITKGEIDHINRNKLDNRRRNLRVVTASQNQAWKSIQSNNTSGYRGVRWSKNAWQAGIKVNGRGIYLGRYQVKEDAARAYDQAAKTYFGEFANLNFKEQT